MFNKGDIVVAKDEYLDKGETLLGTAGIVLEYKPENDYLALGDLHPEKWAIPPISNMRGCFYRLVTEEEKAFWNIV